MTDRIAHTIGILAAAYVIATYRRVRQATAASLQAVDRILKEIWSAEILETQLDLNRNIFDQLAFKNRPEPRAPLLVPGGWGREMGKTATSPTPKTA